MFFILDPRPRSVNYRLQFALSRLWFTVYLTVRVNKPVSTLTEHFQFTLICQFSQQCQYGIRAQSSRNIRKWTAMDCILAVWLFLPKRLVFDFSFLYIQLFQKLISAFAPFTESISNKISNNDFNTHTEKALFLQMCVINKVEGGIKRLNELTENLGELLFFFREV